MAVPKWIEAEVREFLSRTVGKQWKLTGADHVGGDLRLRLQESPHRVVWLRITREALEDDFLVDGKRRFGAAGRKFLLHYFAERLPDAPEGEQVVFSGDARVKRKSSPA